ncbi:MAG: DoxX family protein [Planctomycetaceae bacterium]|nr:DoxX family protein [Planctomycetaceae bacterium]
MLWAGRGISALATLAVLMSGVMKLTKSADVVEGFAKLEYAEKLILPIGVVEVVCVLLYAIPRTSMLGAILLTGYLGGATATHVRLGEPFIAPIILGVLVWLGLFLRDARLRALIPLRS